MNSVVEYVTRLSYIFWIGAALILMGREIGQMNANAVRAQAEVQREARAEFIKAIQAAGMEVHMEEGPSLEMKKG